MTTVGRAKPWLQSHLPPAAYRVVESVAHARPAHRQWARGQARLARHRRGLDDLVVEMCGSESVQRGPFSGVTLRRESAWGLDFSARLLGTYEKELHPHLQRLLGPTTSLIIDVGCADGYYLVGLGRLAPQARLIGYDIDPAALRVSRALAETNGEAHRLELRSACHSRDLESLPPGTFVLMDCEGAEDALITDQVARSNERTRFVIECHESIVPGITDRLIRRFAGRDVTLVEQEGRVHADAPGVPPELVEEVLDEMRAPQDRWLVVA